MVEVKGFWNDCDLVGPVTIDQFKDHCDSVCYEIIKRTESLISGSL